MPALRAMVACLVVLGQLADAAHTAGDDQGCILRCQHLLVRDSCREDAYRLLMMSRARLGQRARVRSWDDVCRRELCTHLDLDPEPETEQAYRAALTGTLSRLDVSS